MEVELERNSFADARINGYAEGLLQRLNASPDSKPNCFLVHDANRTSDYIYWFVDALKEGYQAGIVIDVQMDLHLEDFKDGFVQGWKACYNFDYDKIDEVVHNKQQNKSYLMGFDYGIYDGGAQCYVSQLNEERTDEMLYNPWV
jgi:hypothetical protein